MEESVPLLDKSTSKSRRESRCYLPCRYALAILSCTGFCVVYLLRVNLSVALVAMVNSTYANAKSSANNPECQRNTSTASTEKVSTLVTWFSLGSGNSLAFFSFYTLLYVHVLLIMFSSDR